MKSSLAALGLAAVLAVGCTRAQARVDLEMPQLDPPPPPPRLVQAYELEVATPPDPAAMTETPAPAQPRLPRPQPRPEQPARTEPEPEPARAEPEVPRPATAPALTLKPAVGTEAQTEASIRTLAARALRDLGRVNYASLDADRRAQYDTARRFLQQAEEALRTRNLTFAGKLADKAATMAAVLVR